MAEMRVAAELKPPEPPPESRQPGAVVWVRHNLFSTPFNTVLTVVLVTVLFVVVRATLSWLFAEDRLWDVIPRNSANYAVEAYPRANITRTWISLFVVAVLTGLSLAVWRPTGKTSPLKLVALVRSLGAAAVVLALLSPSTFGGRTILLIAGAVLFVIGVGTARLLGDRAREESVPSLAVLSGAAVLLLAAIWLLPIESTTQVPITIAVALAAVGYLLGRGLISAVSQSVLKPALVAAWLVWLPVNYLHVQRNPIVDWDTVTGSWLPWVAGILVAGLGVIAAVSAADRERGGLINTVVVLAAIGIWLVSAPMVARFLVLVLAAISLATPTFGSSRRGRIGMLAAWTVLALFLTYLFVVGAADTGLETRNEYFGGLNLTMMLAAGSLLLSVPLGLALALGRTSTMPVFRLMSTGYIETIRGVPLITVLFFFRFGILNFIPVGQEIDAIVLVLVGMTMFSAAYLAENVRGGLQSIPKGQYEAAKALGMTTAQMTMLITLPQALRAVIPAIVGQVIALFKDTSLVAIVGLADFFRVVRDIVPNQPTSLGSILENLLFGAVVYWVFTFSFSRASQRLERKLGIGTR